MSAVSSFNLAHPDLKARTVMAHDRLTERT
jgi:hypothetical protein